MKHYFLIFLLSILSIKLAAQVAKEKRPPNYIRSIQLSGVSQNTNVNPVLQLGEPLILKFDDIIGDEADYYYTIEHYNYDWTPTKLVKSEFLIGFDDIRLFNYKNSYNTLQPFSHYELQIPNEDTGGFKVSGNYMINIFNGNEELVFSRKFMVYENIAQVKINIRRSRDLEYIDEKQVVNFTVDSPDLLLKNPNKTVKVLVMQNQNLRTAIKNLQPQYTIANELIYRYDSEAAFWGGNEYLQFDNKELRATTVDISSVSLTDLYHHYLFPDPTRANQPYTYNPDINGKFLINSLSAQNPTIEAEYVWVHFKLFNYSQLNGGEVHIYGTFNNFALDETTKLNYNEASDLYEGARLFKQGYYNYKYVLKRPDGTIDEGFFSGNFDETENSYDVLVYYRAIGARYDRLIGFGTANSTTITN
ncbi:uncharacterized protein DUF5103 [Salegentibacter sp. 24]|uniref:type IX secretion system plug protein n=1 Tax=Salegentibacter sp. 24 TaxID=2183986 RepID=UPI00105FB3E2|nr:DUF5103 domain-containing protein [Salegentibacter sp. 24]TDN81813.1 uncharacterized protein DUF5103 [Salegentibacter sp. 24]